MKYNFKVITLTLLLGIFAQAATFTSVKVGDSSPIDVSAALEVKSTSQAMLVPRMTTTQKNAISGAKNGDIIYDTTLNQFQGFQNGGWSALGGAIAPPAGIVTSNGLTLSSVSDPLPIAHGGTNGTSQTNNGVNFFDGTQINSSSNLTFASSILDLTGQMGIGTSGPNAPLSFGNSTGDKIFLQDNGATHSYGLGIGTNLLQIFSNTSSTDVAIGFGGHSSAFTQNVIFKGNGRVGIGVAPPNAWLDVTGGTTTVPSLILENGLLTTSPVNNAIENDGLKLWWTNDVGTRSQFPLYDANTNLSANNFISGTTSTATAGSTTTLTVGSTYQQIFTGSLNQTLQLPVVSTLVVGQQYLVQNNSRGVITINSSGGNQLYLLNPQYQILVTCISTSGTGTASWFVSQANTPPTVTDWDSTVNQFIPDPTAFGTISNYFQVSKRIGDSLFVKGSFTTGSTTSNPAFFTLPSGLTINTSKLSSVGSLLVGNAVSLSSSSQSISTAGAQSYPFFDGSTNNKVFLAESTISSAFAKTNANNLAFSSQPFVFEFSIPITGWTATNGISPNASGANLFSSSQVTTLSSGISGSGANVYSTFSNSPAFTFTPRITGIWRVYSNATIDVPTNGHFGQLNLTNTSGGATFLFGNPGSIYSQSGGDIIPTVLAESFYILTAGTSYVFDLQGAATSGTSVYLRGDVTPFYMLAELVSGQIQMPLPTSTSRIVKSNTTGSGFSLSTSTAPITDLSSVPLSAQVTSMGGDVEVGLLDDGSGNQGSIMMYQVGTNNAWPKVNIYFYRDGSLISRQEFLVGANTNFERGKIPPSAFRFIETPTAGVHTYTVQGDVTDEDGGSPTAGTVFYTELYARPLN